MRSSVAMRATWSAIARSVNACIRRSGSFTCAAETQQRNKKDKMARILGPHFRGGLGGRRRPGACPTACSMACSTALQYGLLRLLPRGCSAAVGAVLLAMEVTGVRRRMERETVEQRHVIGVYAVAQLIVRRYAKTGYQHARGGTQSDIHHVVAWPSASQLGRGTQSDIHHVVAWPAPADGPSGVVSAERAQAALLRVGNPRNRQVDARDVRHVHA